MRLNLFTTLTLVLGSFWIYDGLHRGFRYYPLLKETPEQLVVSRVANLNGRTILPEYVAIGSVSNVESPVVVAIFESQFRQLKAGASVAVYRRESPIGTEWINGEKIEESKPLMNILGLRFSWHFLAGLFFTGYGYFSARQRRRQLREIINHPNKRSSPADSAAAPPTGPAK